MVMDRSQIENLIGGKLVDSSGKDVGKIGMIYLDDQSNEPDWATVNTGLFGTKETFVPLEGARIDGTDLHVPFTKDQIKDAPNVDADEHLDVDQEEALYRHYGRDYGTTGVRDDRYTETAAAGVAGGVAGNRTADRDRVADVDRDRVADVDRDRVSGRESADGMTLHEERLNVGTERRQAGTARLRKYVTTEQQSVSVPVSREEVRVERTPVNDGRPVRDGAIGEEVQEVTLHEEVPVVNKETVATEQVRLGTQEVRGEQTVSGEVRREHVDVEGVEGDRSGRLRDDADVRDGKVGDDRSLVEKAKDKLS